MGNSPDASLDPTSESSDSSTSTLNKIETSFANNQPVTRSLSSVGKKPGQQQSSSRLPVLASNLSRSGSNANKNSVNKNIYKNKSESLFNNGNNSHVINNNENKNSFNGTSAKNVKN